MTNQTQPFSNCPHLGLSGDSNSVFMMATPSHCCFAGQEMFSPDLEYQAQYCLTKSHQLCSLYDPAKVAEAEQVSNPAPSVDQQPQQPLNPTTAYVSQANAPSTVTDSTIYFETTQEHELDEHTVYTQLPNFTEAVPSEPAPEQPSLVITGQQAGMHSPTTTYRPISNGSPQPSDSRVIPSALAAPMVRPEPIMMPQAKESINFWPLIIGFTALLALLAIYILFNPITVPSNQGSVAEINNNASTPLDLISTRQATDGQGVSSADSNSSGTSITGEVSGELTGSVLTGDDTDDNATENSAFVNSLLEEKTSEDTSTESTQSRFLVQTATPRPTFTAVTTSTPFRIESSADSGTASTIGVTSGGESGSSSARANTANESSLQNAAENTMQSSAPSTNGGSPVGAPTPTSTPLPGGRIVSIKPQLDNAGWWSSDDLERNHLGDSFLYVGRFEDREYISAIRYDLRELARGADIYEGTIQLTGLRVDRFDPNVDADFRLELIAEEEFSGFSRANFLTARSAVAAYQINPTISSSDLTEDGTLTWELTQDMRLWLKQQIIDGARSIIVRIQANVNQGETLYAWDTGQGSQSRDNAPWLVMSVGRAPETPPPFSTRPFIVATSTPVPKNLLTVVAINQGATAIAQTVGTNTPAPYDIYTPTSYPQNLATVQAAAIDRGLPPVVLPTRVASNPEERAAAAQYATAVALTTGTFTPIPQTYVTPQLILPSPIALNVATTVARTAVAESQAQVATPSPLPYNALVAEYVIATTLPENGATAEARRVIDQAMAQTTGTPTPLPWHIVVVSPTPTPLPTIPPTITPTPFLFSAEGFQPTPLPQAPGPEAAPDTLPGQLRRKILFKSDRVNGQVEILAFDPTNGQTFVVNLPWAHDVARRSIAQAPDGQRQATIASVNGEPRIKIVRYENSQPRDITKAEIFGYDAAWSPSGGLIAYVSHISGGDEIYVMNEDGTNQRPLTNTPTFEVKHPTWLNGQIVYHSNQTGRRQLWVMNADGSNARILTGSDANDFEPIYVP